MSSDLVQLVGDEDDGLAPRGEAADDLEELLRLLRREHCRGLVEDEDVRLAIERLQDLDALLLADGDVLDPRGGSTAEPEAVRDLPRRAARPRGVEHDPARGVGSSARTMFSATVITGMSMKCWCTIPTPAPIDALGEPSRTGVPLMTISPSSAWYRP